MKTRSIIYVEDDENDVFLMKRAFKESGIENSLVICRDGQEAIEMLAALNVTAKTPDDALPAFLLLDLNLPRKTGHDVLGWVRGNSSLHNLVVIVLTSSSHALDVRNAYGLGANAYLVKPPMFDALVDLVSTIREFWLKQNFAPPLTAAEGGASKGRG